MSSEEATVKLISRDGEEFIVKEKFATMSKHIKYLVEDTGTDEPIPVPNVGSETLTRIIQYCEQHHSNPPKEIEKPLRSKDLSEVVDDWDVNFINLDQNSLVDIINAANYLDIAPLLDLACAKIASMIHGKSVEEIRTLLGIENDFTPEEEAKVREENKWCEDA